MAMPVNDYPSGDPRASKPETITKTLAAVACAVLAVLWLAGGMVLLRRDILQAFGIVE